MANYMANIAPKTRTKKALLGIITDISSDWWQNFDPVTMKYYLQSVSRNLLNHNRLNACMRLIAPTKGTVEIRSNPELEIAHFRNLCRCENVWICPVCASTITERRKHELATIIANSNYQTFMGTFTLRHKQHQTLKHSLTVITKAWYSFTGGEWWQNFKKEFGLVGQIRATEVTYGWNGWHPHFHVLFFFERETTAEALYKHTVDRWVKFLKKKGGSGTKKRSINFQKSDDFISEYMAKWGHNPQGVKWSIEHEMAKQPVKRSKSGGLTPQNILMVASNPDMPRDARGKAIDLWREYYKATFRKNQLNGLKKMLDHLELEYLDDSEIIEREAVEYDLLTELEPYDWEKVIWNDQRAKILNIASQGDVEYLHAFIRDLPSKPKKEFTVIKQNHNYEHMRLNEKTTLLQSYKEIWQHLEKERKGGWETGRGKELRLDMARRIKALKASIKTNQMELPL